MNFFTRDVPPADFKPTGADRRQFERRVFRVDARLLIPGMPAVNIRTLDLSVGGLAVISPFSHEAGTLASIQLPLKLIGRPPVHIEALVTIMHSFYSGDHQGFKVGLRFNGLSANVTGLVARFVLGQ